MNKPMNKEQQQILIRAWEKQRELLTEIIELANDNVLLAYGLIRAAETIIDVMMISKIRAEEKAQEGDEKKG